MDRTAPPWPGKGTAADGSPDESPERRELPSDQADALDGMISLDILVGVTDRIPAYRQGLLTALRAAGFVAEAVPDAAAWVAEPGRRALLASVSLPEESAALAAVTAAGENPVVVALLREPTLRAYAEALRAGAAGAVAWDDTPETVIRVLRASLEDQCLLPVSMARALFVNDSLAVDITDVSQEEVRWLQVLANGGTVGDLSRQAAYSEREMFRLLHRLYQRMGARNRMEALVIAARSGLLPSETDPSTVS